MKLTEFIVDDAIVPDLQAADRDAAIRELVRSLADAGALDASAVDEVVAALVKREQNGSTGFGKGVAVPHVKHPSVKKMVGTVGRSPRGLDFSALDAQPVYIVFMLLSPDDEPQQHLQAMEIVFRRLQLDMFRRMLREADSSQKMKDVLAGADGG